MMLRLLAVGLVAFVIALIDSFRTQAESFSDLDFVGKFFCAVVIGVIVAWFVLLGKSLISKK